MNFKTLLLEQQRLGVLQILSEAKGYDLNSAILQGSLKGLGLSISRDQLHTQLSWLEEQDLIECNPLPGLIVARLTLRGMDVAKGLAVVPGVAQPEPGV